MSQKIESKKQDIRNLSRTDLAAFFETHAEKSFRANQVYDWLWKKDVANFTEMTNLSLSLRNFLDAHFYAYNKKREGSLPKQYVEHPILLFCLMSLKRHMVTSSIFCFKLWKMEC